MNDFEKTLRLNSFIKRERHKYSGSDGLRLVRVPEQAIMSEEETAEHVESCLKEEPRYDVVFQNHMWRN